MALCLAYKFRDRLQAQTEIDPDFSEMMFTYTDETDSSARKRMLEDYWQLKEGALKSHDSYSCLQLASCHVALIARVYYNRVRYMLAYSEL